MGDEGAALGAVDWAVLRRVADEVGVESLDEVLEGFAREIELQAEAIARDARDGALSDIEFRAHRLRADAGAVGAHQLAELARFAECAARAEDLVTAREALVGLRGAALDALRELARFRECYRGG